MLVAYNDLTYLSGLCCTLPMLPAVMIVGHAVYVVPARNDPVLCPRRRFSLWFACVGFVIGSVVCLLGTGLNDACVPLHLIGLLAGGVVGRVVGWFVWAIWLNEPVIEPRSGGRC